MRTNKDLELPTQAELIAQFRCDEIYHLTLTEFNEQISRLKALIDEGGVHEDGLGTSMDVCMTQALGGCQRTFRRQKLTAVRVDRYDRDASRYHQAVYKRRREDLFAMFDSLLSPIYEGQLGRLREECRKTFDMEIEEGKAHLIASGEGDFETLVETACTHCQERFHAVAEKSVAKGMTWTWTAACNMLIQEARNTASNIRRRALADIVDGLAKVLFVHIIGDI